MSKAGSNPPTKGPRGAENPQSGSHLTHVDLTWIKGRIEHWIRFGRPVDETIQDAERRFVSFAPGSAFAFVRWAANDFGTIRSRIDIIRAVPRGAGYQTVPFVRPGGELLLHLNGWSQVERVLQAVDAIEALGIDPVDVAPDHWRHLHNRLTAGHQPRAYSLAAHHAWLLRRTARS
jgi:SAM-dependent methyltransferase